MTLSTLFARSVSALVLLSLAGCPVSRRLLDVDAGEAPLDGASERDVPDRDAPPLDVPALLDVPPDAAPSIEGAECEVDADCADLCAGVPGCRAQCGIIRRCLRVCEGLGGCEAGRSCVHWEGDPESTCNIDCDPRAEDPCVARGLGCGALSPTAPMICVPGCSDDHDCDEGQFCLRDTMGGRCFVPLAPLGASCESDSTCSDRQFCFPSGEGTAGACVSNVPCTSVDECDELFGSGATCAEIVDGGALCTLACSVDADCAGGFVCRVAAGVRACLPPA